MKKYLFTLIGTMEVPECHEATSLKDAYTIAEKILVINSITKVQVFEHVGTVVSETSYKVQDPGFSE